MALSSLRRAPQLKSGNRAFDLRRAVTSGLMEFQYWKLGYLIPFHTENPPRTGTYKQKVITGSVTLECTAPIASARIKNISK